MASAAPVKIKTEPGVMEDYEARFLELCKENEAGVNQSMLMKAIPEISTKQLMDVINALFKKKQIQIRQKNIKGKNDFIYLLRDPSASGSGDSGAPRGDRPETMLYEVIKNAGNKGIWIRDIRLKTNMTIHQINKLLKNMLTNKIIKAVQDVNAAKKKIYMLYNLVPDSSLTGGAWFSGDSFDEEFADLVSEFCHRFLQNKEKEAKERISNEDMYAQYLAGHATVEEVHQSIMASGISTIALSPSDIEQVLMTLVYDGKAKEVTQATAGTSSGESGKMFRVAHRAVDTTGLMKIPCGYCPLIGECRPGGVISPQTCEYMKEWMAKVTW